jgi:Reverse transcriptase (RNA-dependent DNA polymerase)
VIINVWETISFCRYKGINGGLIAIDMAKAFDTLSHKFLSAVLKFFGFGPNIIRTLELIGNNRQACILGEGAKNSKYFPLGRGRPQGDTVSPNTFNFGGQVLIFKIELDPRIKCIPRIALLCVETNVIFMQESNRETSKNESLADDNSTLQLLDREGISATKEILSEFAAISGLKCNYEKTVIMPFLDNLDNDTVQILNESGFRIVDKVELLGVCISRDLNSVDENVKKIRGKIVAAISYWERFRLSLAGRLSVAKTFLMPLINYIGCILTPSNASLDEIQALINGYVRKNLKISNERLYQELQLGGVGMFNLKDFLDAQRVSWLMRAFKLPIDIWRYDLHRLSPGNKILNIRTCDVDPVKNPILYCIVTAYCKVNGTLSKLNMMDSVIFYNNCFRVPGTNNLLNDDFFDRAFFRRHREAIRQLTLKDCFSNNVIKSMLEFSDMGLCFTFAMYFRFLGAIRKWKNEYESIGQNIVPDFSVKKLFENTKKGSKKLRLTVKKVENADLNLSDSVSVRTLCRLIDCESRIKNIYITGWAFGKLFICQMTSKTSFLTVDLTRCL